MRRRSIRVSIIVATLGLTAACSSATNTRSAQVVPEQPAIVKNEQSAPPPAVLDPVAELIAAADRHFAAGRNELTLGHLTRAKVEFNQSLEVLLESPQGARTDQRLRDHFDRLVDRIAALELTALATGDGFTERTHEPASIDELLAISTFETSKPTAATTENVQADLQETAHDIPIP